MTKKQQRPPVPKKSNTSEAVSQALPKPNPQLVTVQKQELFQGPIPHPDLLRKYNEVLPGAAERILHLAEDEQDHRHKMDLIEAENNRRIIVLSESDITSANQFQKRGQIFGFIVSAACILGAGCSAFVFKLEWEIVVAFLALPTASLIRAYWDRGKQKVADSVQK